MKSYLFMLIIALFILSISFLNGQVQWADKVLGYSSSYSDSGAPYRYSAEQVLGYPNTFPIGKSSPCAWSPKYPYNPRGEFIKVGFAYPQKVRQILVSESFNGGSLYRIYLYNRLGVPHCVYEQQKANYFLPVPPTASITRIVLDKPTSYRVGAVRIELKTLLTRGWNHIDAIAISSSEDSIPIEIKEVKKGMVIKQQRLDRTVNSENDELVPVASPDGRSLYFARRESGQDDIWVYRDEKATKLAPFINNENNNYVYGIFPITGELVVNNVYGNDATENSEGIAVISLTGNTQAKPQQLKIDSYQNNSHYLDFSLSYDGEVLLMALARDDTRGDRDIYVSFRKRDNTFTVPKNLGSSINTPHTELTPFLGIDKKTLYFSSLGYAGYGEADVYMAKRLDDSWTSWSEPRNLGRSINSAGWESSFTTDATGNYGYYNSSRSGHSDIFKVWLNAPYERYLLLGKVQDMKTRKAVRARLEVRDQAGRKVKAVIADKFGEFFFVLNNKRGTLAVSKYNYFTQQIEINSLFFAYRAELGIEMKRIVRGEKIGIENILFEQSRSILLPEGEKAVQELVNMMLQTSSLRIRLEGHADVLGDAKINKELSCRRVQVIKHILLKNGVASERIETIGYGSEKPIVRTVDMEGRKKNRRVEIVIL